MSDALAEGKRYWRELDNVRYHLTDHIGSVRALISDIKIPVDVNEWEAELVSVADYDSYGQLRPNRFYGEDIHKYPYGFQGMQRQSQGDHPNLYRTPFRDYDASTQSWLSHDAIIHTWQSPYNAFASNPVMYTDPYGLTTGGDKKASVAAAPAVAPTPPGANSSQVNKPDAVVKDPLALPDPRSIHAIWPKPSADNTSVYSGQQVITGTPDPNFVNSGDMVRSVKPTFSDSAVPKVSTQQPIAPLTNDYVITNPELRDGNWGQYPANDKPAASGNVHFVTYITPVIVGGGVYIAARVEYSNPMGDPISFTSVAYHYNSDGELVKSQALSTDCSNGKMYFEPLGSTGSTTPTLMDANDDKPQNYSVQVETTGVVSTPAGIWILATPGTLNIVPNKGINGFDLELPKK